MNVRVHGVYASVIAACLGFFYAGQYLRTYAGKGESALKAAGRPLGTPEYITGPGLIEAIRGMGDDPYEAIDMSVIGPDSEGD